ncbi:MAG: HupE/UreJ family protein [Fimbriimonas sp.]
MGIRFVVLCLLALLVNVAFAHPANVAVSMAKVDPDGTFTLRIRFDVIAFATGASPKDADDEAMTVLIDGPEEGLRESLTAAAGNFRRGLVIGIGGEIDQLEFPTAAAVHAFLARDPNPRLPVMLDAVVRGHLPKGTRSLSFRYPDTFGVVIQTVEFPYHEPISEPVEPRTSSRVLTIPTAEEVAKLAAAMNAPRPTVEPTAKPKVVAKSSVVAKVAPPKPAPPKTPVVNKPEVKPEIPAPKVETVAKVPAPPQAVAEPPFPAEEDASPPVVEPPPSAGGGSRVATYVKMGFTHILPEGLDHILFVLGLFLLGSNAKALLKQVTAFTVAHSITLALATLGVVHVPGRFIEPLIALSIAFVAAENLFVKEVRASRTAVVFSFGLVHGMGFAEVFTDAGLRGPSLLTALLSFNVGVELGQLAVVGLALAGIGWFRKDQRYRAYVVVPASAMISAVALFWTVERMFG